MQLSKNFNLAEMTKSQTAELEKAFLMTLVKGTSREP